MTTIGTLGNYQVGEWREAVAAEAWQAMCFAGHAGDVPAGTDRYGVHSRLQEVNLGPGIRSLSRSSATRE